MTNNKVIKFQKPVKKKENLSSKRGYALYNEGLCFDNQGKDKLALKKYLESEKNGYESADLFAYIARLYNVFEDFEKAKIYAQKSISIDEEYAYPYYLMGGSCYELEDYKNSLKYYLKAEKLGYDFNVVMFRDISDVYGKIAPENIIKQLEYATKAIDMDPDNAYSYYWKGWIYFRHDYYKQALKFFLKAEQMGYNAYTSYYEISYCYTMTDNLKKALAYANKCIFIDKEDHLGYYRKGWAYYNVGEYKQAKKMFLTAEEKDCNIADMYTSLGYIYQVEGNFDKSIEYCKRAIKLDKDETDAYTQTGNAYAALKRDYKSALKFYKKAYKKGYTLHETFYSNYAMLYYMLNRHSMALKIINEGLERFPKSYNLLSIKICSIQMKKQYELGKKLTDELVLLEPENEWNYYYLALANYNQKVKNRDYNKVLYYMNLIKSDEVLDMGGCYAVISFSFYGIKDYKTSLRYFIKFFESKICEEFLIKNRKEIKKYFKRLLKKFPENEFLKELIIRYPQYFNNIV